MLSYKTGISALPPLTPDTRAKALSGLTAPIPEWGLAGGQNRADNYAAYQQANAVESDRANQMANAEYVQKAQDLQSQLVQRGLQQMAQAQQNQTDLGTRQYQMALDRTQGMFNNVNSLLGGLFR